MAYSSRDNEEIIARMREIEPLLRVATSPRPGTLSSIKGNLDRFMDEPKAGVPEKERVYRFLEKYRDLFGLREPRSELTSRDEDRSEDARGNVCIVFLQHDKTIPVYAGMITARFSNDGPGSPKTLRKIESSFFPGVDINVSDRTENLDAVRKAAETVFNGNASYDGARAPHLEILIRGNKPRLCWVVRLQRELHGARHTLTCYVDAGNGKPLIAMNGLKMAKTALGYYCGRHNELPSEKVSGAWKLIDNTRCERAGPKITVHAIGEILTCTFDATEQEEQIKQIPLKTGNIAEDADNRWGDVGQFRKNDQRPLVDAMVYAGAIVDDLKDRYNWNALDGKGGDISIGVHWGENYNNACFSPSQEAFYLGDGDGKEMDFLSAKDILAHEFGHAISYYTVRFEGPIRRAVKKKDGETKYYLTLYPEHCALDEGIADVFALLCDRSDGEIASEIFARAENRKATAVRKPGKPWKADQNPPLLRPLVHHRLGQYDYREEGEHPQGGGFRITQYPHVTCGIVSHAFHLLIHGGKHQGSGISVNGINYDMAGEIFFHAVTNGLKGKRRPTFLQFREAMIDAVEDIFEQRVTPMRFLGIMESVKNALTAVGIGPDLYIRNDTDDGGSRPHGFTTADSPDIELREKGTGRVAEEIVPGRDYEFNIRVQNRGTDRDKIGFTIAICWEDSPDREAGCKWRQITPMTRKSTFTIGARSERIAGPFPWRVPDMPGQDQVRILCVVDGGVLDPAPAVDMSDADAVKQALCTCNNFAQRAFGIAGTKHSR